MNGQKRRFHDLYYPVLNWVEVELHVNMCAIVTMRSTEMDRQVLIDRASIARIVDAIRSTAVSGCIAQESCFMRQDDRIALERLASALRVTIHTPRGLCGVSLSPDDAEGFAEFLDSHMRAPK